MKFPVTLALAAVVGAGPAFADPPAHAPAHGYYKKHHDREYRYADDDRRSYRTGRYYEGKSGVAYVRDYGISSGRCNRDEIGTVIGGVTGAVISMFAGAGGWVTGAVIANFLSPLFLPKM